MNHHHGMQAEERFDLNPDKGIDYDEDGHARELTIGDITAISIFQAQLGTPARVLPDTDEGRESAERGEQVFDQVGCTTCHVPMLELDSSVFTEPYALNPAGTWSDQSAVYSFDMTEEGEYPRLESNGSGGAEVWAFTDLKRHNLCDPEGTADAITYFCNETLAQGRPDQDGAPGTAFFLTRKLWDVGNSAPYGHRGDLTTISEAILMHGGEGRASRDAFAALPAQGQEDVVTFLKTLQVLPAEDTHAAGFLADNANLLIAIAAGIILVLATLLFLRRRPRGAHAS
jgi:cytochrome c peroxidase